MSKKFITTVISFVLLLCAVFVFQNKAYLLGITQAESASTNGTIYEDGLSEGWNSWSWNSSVSFDNTSPTFSGTHSISFTPLPWGGLYIHSDQGIQSDPFTELHFELSSANEKNFSIMVYDQNNKPLTQTIPLSTYKSTTTDNWTKYAIPLSILNAQNKRIKGIAIQETSGNQQPTVFVDDILFYAPTPTPTPTPIQTLSSSNDDLHIYDEMLQKPWINWSWNSSVSFNSSATANTGTTSISFDPTSGWAGFYLHSSTNIQTANFETLSLSLKATGDNQQFGIIAYDGQNKQLSNAVPLSNFGDNLIKDSWKNYSIPLKDINASDKELSGFAIVDRTGNDQPLIYIDTIVLNAKGGSTSTSQTITPTSAISLTPTPISQPSSVGYTAIKGKIYQQGSPITLKGVSWFGFETDTSVPHGLWSRNWKDMITQMKSLGFNSVRLPFCPATLHGRTPTSIDYGKNSDLKGMNSTQLLDAFMQELNNQHMYILLDHHRPDCQAISELWYTNNYSEQQWLNDLTTIAQKYKNLPYFMGIDLKNEPHGKATWGTGNEATDWNTASEKAGKAVLSVNPNLLVFIQGIQENTTCSSTTAHWMGGNLEPQACKPISTNAIPADKLVLSPHVYGPDVSDQPYFSDQNFPSNMPQIWEKHFGSFSSSTTVIPGEWGSKYGNNGGSTKDVQLQNELVNYFKSKHICNSYFWSWNPNSTDTGGVLQDDWQTPWSNKMNLIQSYFNSCS